MAELTITVPALAVTAEANATDTANLTVKFSGQNGQVYIMNKPDSAAITVADGEVTIDSDHVSFDSKYGSYDIGEATFDTDTKVLTIPVTYTGTKASFVNASFESQLHVMAVDGADIAFASFAPVITPSTNGKILLQFFHDISRGYTKKSIIRRLIRKAGASLTEADVLAAATKYSDIFEACGFELADNFVVTLINHAYDTSNPRSLVIAAQTAMDGEYSKDKCDAILAGARNAFDLFNNYVDYLAAQEATEEVVEDNGDNGDDQSDSPK